MTEQARPPIDFVSLDRQAPRCWSQDTSYIDFRAHSSPFSHHRVYRPYFSRPLVADYLPSFFKPESFQHPRYCFFLPSYSFLSSLFEISRNLNFVVKARIPRFIRGRKRYVAETRGTVSDLESIDALATNNCDYFARRCGVRCRTLPGASSHLCL